MASLNLTKTVQIGINAEQDNELVIIFLQIVNFKTKKKFLFLNKDLTTYSFLLL